MRGEFWITPDQVINVAGRQHDAWAYAALLQVPIEQVNAGWLMNGPPKEFLIRAKAEVRELLKNYPDVRYIMIKFFGWIRVARKNTTLWKLDEKTLDMWRNASAFWDQAAPEEYDQIDIEEFIPGGRKFSVSVNRLRDTNLNAAQIRAGLDSVFVQEEAAPVVQIRQRSQARGKTWGYTEGDNPPVDSGIITENVFDEYCEEINNFALNHGLPMPDGALKKCELPEELGCGYFGCVYPTPDKNIVFKITSDNHELEFYNLYLPLLQAGTLKQPDGLLKYSGFIELEKDKLAASWRESVDQHGEYVLEVLEQQERLDILDYTYHQGTLIGELGREPISPDLLASAFAKAENLPDSHDAFMYPASRLAKLTNLIWYNIQNAKLGTADIRNLAWTQVALLRAGLIVGDMYERNLGRTYDGRLVHTDPRIFTYCPSCVHVKHRKLKDAPGQTFMFSGA